MSSPRTVTAVAGPRPPATVLRRLRRRARCRLPACGRPLARTPRSAPAAARPAPDRRRPPAQEDRRRVSVLFVDLIDFTPVRRAGRPGAGPRHADRLLLHGPAGHRPVRRGGGEVHRRRGDGAVRRAGGHRDRRAALRAGRAGAATGAGPVHARTGAARLRFRVGVATGEALVDVAAARDGGQAIVAGDVVNTASRLQSVAPPGGVLVCGTTYALTRTHPLRRPAAGRRCAAAPRRPRCGWPWPRCSGNQPDREADTTPLVDREHELGLLVNALHRSLRDRMPAAGHRVRPGRHRQEPAGARAVPARRAAGRRSR